LRDGRPIHQLIDEDSPELNGPFVDRSRLIVPSEVLAALAAESKTPAISGKPGVGARSPTDSHSPRAGEKGLEIKFHARRIHKKMTVPALYGNQPVRMRYKAATRDALVHLGAIASDPVQNRLKNVHVESCNRRIRAAGGPARQESFRRSGISVGSSMYSYRSRTRIPAFRLGWEQPSGSISKCASR